MTMTAPPAKTAISDTYPLPTNATARTGFGALWDYVTGLLGSTGFTSSMLDTSKLLDPHAIYNVSLVPSVAGNALTMKLTSRDGSTALAAGNPATIAQRNATLATGTYNLRNITADVSTVISSGSTAGHANATAGFLHWYLIDNAGTMELAWSTKNFGGSGIVSTTAEGGAGAADSSTTMYSTTARSSVPFRMVGRTTDTQTTAGTWTALPTSVELCPLSGGVFTYEEGTWTPSVGGSATYTSRQGTYTRIGDRVFANCSMVINAIGTGSAVNISGLPYVANNDSVTGAGVVSFFQNLASSVVWLGCYMSANSAVISLIKLTAAATSTTSASVMGSGTEINLAITYRV